MTRNALTKLQDELRAGWTSRRPHRWSEAVPSAVPRVVDAPGPPPIRCIRPRCVATWNGVDDEPLGCTGQEPS